MLFQQINQPLLIVDWHTRLLAFRQFRASILADDQMAERLADARSDSAAKPYDALLCRWTCHAGEAPRQQECLPNQRPADLLLLLYHVHTSLVQTLDKFPVLWLLKPVIHTMPDL